MEKVLVFIFDNMTDYEVTFITHLLGTSGNKEIITVAYEDNIIKGRSGFKYKPDKILKDVMDDNVNGLIITGGWNGDFRPELKELINRLNSQGKLLAGICGAGTVFLAKAGVFDNVKYTTPVEMWTEKHGQMFGEDDPFPRSNFVQQGVVRDKNIITAHGTAFIDFAVEICDWFDLFENKVERDAFTKSIKR